VRILARKPRKFPAFDSHQLLPNKLMLFAIPLPFQITGQPLAILAIVSKFQQLSRTPFAVLKVRHLPPVEAEYLQIFQNTQLPAI